MATVRPDPPPENRWSPPLPRRFFIFFQLLLNTGVLFQEKEKREKKKG